MDPATLAALMSILQGMGGAGGGQDSAPADPLRAIAPGGAAAPPTYSPGGGARVHFGGGSPFKPNAAAQNILAIGGLLANILRARGQRGGGGAGALHDAAFTGGSGTPFGG